MPSHAQPEYPSRGWEGTLASEATDGYPTLETPPNSMPASSSAHRLRYGVMCDAIGLPHVARACMEHIADIAEPALLIVNNSEPQYTHWKEKLRKAIRLDGNLWHLQNRLFPIQHIPAYQKRPLDESFPNVPRLVCAVTRKGRWSEYFAPDDIARIRKHDLDFILRFSYGIIRGAILSAARYGVWSYHHDDEERYRGGPPAFWEIHNGDPITGALLQRLNDRLDGGVVLKKIFVPTIGMSHARNLQNILQSSTHMVRWVCLDIRASNASYLDDAPSPSMAPIFRAPTDRQVIRFWWRLVRNWVQYKLANQRVDEWNIGLVEASPHEFLKESFDPAVEWSTYRERDQMVADPFLVPDAGRVRVLCEEFSWFSETGRILEITRGPDGGLSRGKAAIDEAVHMSYPYTFEHSGALYCIPECGSRREVALYRWDSGTATWMRDTVLLNDIAAVDATVLEVDGRWWLLHSSDGGVGPWSLYIWTAESLRGPWSPHPGNPVKTDVRSSRPAGQPFWHEGKLYRPVQDGSRSYGGAMAINWIKRLSLTDFQETTVRRIPPKPGWPYPDGIHTLNSFAGLCVIDAKRHVWPLSLILKRAWSKLTKAPRPPVFRYRSGRFRLVDGPSPIP